MRKRRNYPLVVEIKNGVLSITIGINTLGFAAIQGPYFNHLWNIYEGKEPKITSYDLFSKAILSELRAEEENGSTLVHKMLDKAAEKAVEYGAEGIILPGEKEYENG